MRPQQTGAPSDSQLRATKAAKGKRAVALSQTQQTSQDSVRVVVPPNQVKLTPEELNAEHEVQLSASNPHNLPDNIMRFSYRDKVFRTDGVVSQTQFHVELDSALVYKEDVYSFMSRYSEAGSEELLRNQFNFSNRGVQTFYSEPKEVGVETNPPNMVVSKGSFSRSQIYDTYKAYKRQQAEKEAAESGQTRAGKKEAAVDRKIGDERDDPLFFTAPEGTALEAETITMHRTDTNQLSAIASLSTADKDHVRKALELAERLVSENAFGEVISDFAFWNDPSDEYKGDGSLLPLWTFQTNSKEVSAAAEASAAPSSTAPPASTPFAKAVSAIVFHPKHHDLFAVAYGSYDFKKTSLFPPSCVSVFSLKNPFHPEKVVRTPCDALCVDWHPDRPDLLLVGLYDGNVAVYNLSSAEGASAPADDGPEGADGAAGVSLVCMSSSVTGKHTEAVWAAKWRSDSANPNTLSFVTGSTDGTVRTWALVKTDLRLVSTMKVVDNKTDDDVPTQKKAKSDAKANATPTGDALHAAPSVYIAERTATSLVTRQQPDTPTQSPPTSGILCIQFNPTVDWLYAIATDSGLVRLCSTAYLSTYVQTFSRNAHSMPIYGMSWNRYSPNLLATCSEDYTVKLWQRERRSPIYTIDFNSPVADVAFSDAVACEIVAGTVDGNLVVYDFGQRKESPMCVQAVIPSGAKLTKLSLSSKYPIVAVGDDRGAVRVFKLSPNLRKRTVVEQPKQRGGVPVPQYTPEELLQMAHDAEVQKLSNFVAWCIKANIASGIL